MGWNVGHVTRSILNELLSNTRGTKRKFVLIGPVASEEKWHVNVDRRTTTPIKDG